MPANALLETSTIMTIIVGFGLGWLIPPNTSFSIFDTTPTMSLFGTLAS